MDWILSDSYSNQASAQQKKTVTRLARMEQAQEFIEKGLSSLAEVLLSKPFTNRAGHALAAKLISYTQMGRELALTSLCSRQSISTTNSSMAHRSC